MCGAIDHPFRLSSPLAQTVEAKTMMMARGDGENRSFSFLALSHRPSTQHPPSLVPWVPVSFLPLHFTLQVSGPRATVTSKRKKKVTRHSN